MERLFRDLRQATIVAGKADELDRRYRGEMTRASRSYGVLIVVLAAIWGASYLFIKVGVRDFEPTVLVTLRLLIAGILLLAFLAAREGGGAALRSVRRRLARGADLRD